MSQDLTPPDAWAELRRHTPARIALGRAGASLPTRELLAFGAAHAQARDAVHLALDVPTLREALPAGAVLEVASRAPDRAAYLRRPDWGRQLDDASAQALDRATDTSGVDVAVVAGDGLSALAVQRQLPPLLAALAPLLADLRVAPWVIARQARVALGDEIGQRLHASAVLMLVGERPGLSSPDSLGAYLTFSPQPGRQDAERNCVSNIRPQGLAPELAAARLNWLLREALRRRVSGLALKDDSETALLDADPRQIP